MGIKVLEEAKGLIFDLDGTMSDSLPLHVSTWKKVGEKYGFIFDTKIVTEMTGMPTIEFAKRLVNENGLSADPHEITRMKQQSFWDSAHLIQPIEEVVSIVKRNHGKIPMAVGTGASRNSAEVQLDVLNLNKYFEIIITANDVTKHKPHPDTFLECARLLNVEPQYCQVFEDGDLGINAAQKAGMFFTDVRPYINYGEWILS